LKKEGKKYRDILIIFNDCFCSIKSALMMKHIFHLILLLLLCSCQNNNSSKQKELRAIIAKSSGCYSPAVNDKDWYSSGRRAPILNGLQGIDLKISTTNKEAQDYFNQGMMLAYGFNHAEAARSFYEAMRLDSTCAMAHWGFAYVLGPNYNGGMEEDNFQRAYDAALKSRQLARNCTPKEKALIAALATRYAAQPPEDRKPLDEAYAAAMKKVYHQYPSDPDIGALYAESLMNLHPWDLYQKKTKTAQPWTPELVSVLELLIKTHPRHPGAHHFYIHAMEASPTPEKALTSARLLETLVPGSGHLLHMPSHIYINTGDYHLASLSNISALKTDSMYTTACHAQGVYPLAYYPHNYHFLAATASLEGNSSLAWQAALQVQKHTAQSVMRQPGWGTLQHYYTIPYYVAVKLALWDSLLSLPLPPEDLVYPKAIWHYARGMAYLGKNDLSKARNEMQVLSALAVDTTLNHLTVWDINTTADLVQLASKVLQAGIAVKQGQTSLAITLLKDATAIEDNLNYNEPPDWFFSIRHYLGAVLLKAGKYKEAEHVYLQDLETWKKNGWALLGLYQSLVLQKKKSEAEKIKSAFDKSWQYADFTLTSSSELMK
jgi:tetratricopeptide (TPR) repeat protein